MGPMIRASSLRGFGALVRDLGGDPAELLGRFDISAAALASDDALLPITSHDLMLDAAARELDCPDLGLRLAESQDLSILGPLALAIESSPTVADAIQCASRFMFVHSPALSIGVEPDPHERRGVVALTYRKDLSESTYSPQAIELGVSLFDRVAVGLLGTATGLRSVLFPHQPLSPVRRYTDFFGADVRFGAPAAALCVDRRILGVRFEGSDARIRVMALDYLADHHPDPAAGVTGRVRRTVAQSLGVGVPTLGHTASLLSMSTRTLQRRLTQEGTSFEVILDDVRRDAAHRLLTTTSLPIGQVAALVGMSEQSTLAHAVRRWFGQSPRELRRTASVGEAV